MRFLRHLLAVAGVVGVVVVVALACGRGGPAGPGVPGRDPGVILGGQAVPVLSLSGLSDLIRKFVVEVAVIAVVALDQRRRPAAEASCAPQAAGRADQRRDWG